MLVRRDALALGEASPDAPPEVTAFDAGQEELAQALLQRETELAEADSSLLLATMSAVPAVDLRTLLSEMVALKSEVRTETKAVREIRDHVDRAVGQMREQTDNQAQRELHREQALSDVRRQLDRRFAEVLIDVADRLEASLAQPTTRKRWYWPFAKHASRELKALRHGLELTLQRVQEQLEQVGVERINTLGQPFDAEMMEAVDTVSVTTLANLSVAEEITAGYRALGSSMVRRAQVVVNRVEVQ